MCRLVTILLKPSFIPFLWQQVSLLLWLLWRIRERLDLANVSDYLRGAAVSLVTAGILSLAFMGFKGMITL